MARVINNEITEGLSGSVSAMSKYTFRRSHGKTFLVRKSERRKGFSENQLEVRSKFKAAVLTASSLITDYPENVEMVEKRLHGTKYSTVMGYLVACAYKNNYPEWVVRG